VGGALCPGQLPDVQATQEPAPSHTLAPSALQDVPAETGVLVATPAAHSSAVQGLPSLATSVLSIALATPPAPSH
jgi:hypothetical protein